MPKPLFLRVAGVWRVAMAAKHNEHRYESVRWCVERNRAAGMWRPESKIVIAPCTLELFRHAIGDPISFWSQQ